MSNAYFGWTKLIPCLNGQVWFLTEILKSVMLVVVNKNDNCITLFSYSEWWRCKDRRDHDNPGNGRCQPERDDRTIRVWNIRSAFIERIFYCISPVAMFLAHGEPAHQWASTNFRSAFCLLGVFLCSLFFNLRQLVEDVIVQHLNVSSLHSA